MADGSAAGTSRQDDGDDKLSQIVSHLDAIHKRLDDDDDRQRRRDDDEDRGHFSHRMDDDDDDKFKSRHDAEEGELREKLEKHGVEPEKAADRAKRARKDAERCDEDARKHFTDRRDDDDDAKFKARRDAEEEELAKKHEKEGEKEAEDDDAKKRRHDDARRHAHDARSRRDDDDRKRMDKKRMDDDAAKKRMDAHRMDDDNVRKRMDDARADAQAKENAELRASLKALEAQIAAITRETPPEDRDALGKAQFRADAVAVMFSDRAPQPVPGETSVAYRRRLAERFKKHSNRFKDEKLDGLGSAALAAAEDIIYADAVSTARNVPTSTPGMLIPEITVDAAGRQLTRYHGDPLAWMMPFMTGGQSGRINRNPKGV